jgi:hypothetical protein
MEIETQVKKTFTKSSPFLSDLGLSTCQQSTNGCKNGYIEVEVLRFKSRLTFFVQQNPYKFEEAAQLIPMGEKELHDLGERTFKRYQGLFANVTYSPTTFVFESSSIPRYVRWNNWLFSFSQSKVAQLLERDKVLVHLLLDSFRYNLRFQIWCKVLSTRREEALWEAVSHSQST